MREIPRNGQGKALTLHRLNELWIYPVEQPDSGNLCHGDHWESVIPATRHQAGDFSDMQNYLLISGNPHHFTPWWLPCFHAPLAFN